MYIYIYIHTHIRIYTYISTCTCIYEPRCWVRARPPTTRRTAQTSPSARRASAPRGAGQPQPSPQVHETDEGQPGKSNRVSLRASNGRVLECSRAGNKTGIWSYKTVIWSYRIVIWAWAGRDPRRRDAQRKHLRVSIQRQPCGAPCRLQNPLRPDPQRAQARW